MGPVSDGLGGSMIHASAGLSSLQRHWIISCFYFKVCRSRYIYFLLYWYGTLIVNEWFGETYFDVACYYLWKIKTFSFILRQRNFIEILFAYLADRGSLLLTVITHPCPNFNVGWVKLPLNLRYGWVIRSIRKQWVQFLIHAKSTAIRLWIYLTDGESCTVELWWSRLSTVKTSITATVFRVQ